jgi:hypothetical protein
MFKELTDKHVIKTMFKEHEHILSILDDLEELRGELLEKNRLSLETLLPRINNLSLQLISAEPHHKREEDVLFPAMEEIGINGPPHVMKVEHELIREMKHDLKNETENSGKDLEKQVDRVSQLILRLCSTLRKHIDKENNILYPMALQSITEEAKWIDMKKRCDEIGYCCFCPSNQRN